jgi:hypothetical protein
MVRLVGYIPLPFHRSCLQIAKYLKHYHKT